MSQDNSIIIILGSAGAGKTLAKAAKRLIADEAKRGQSSSPPTFSTGRRVVIEHYSRAGLRIPFFKCRTTETLLEIETAVRKQMQKIKTAPKVTSIMFVHGKKRTAFPFKKDTQFLGLRGTALFQKLVVVQTPGADMPCSDLGMRVCSFDGKPKSASGFVGRLLNEAPAERLLPVPKLPGNGEVVPVVNGRDPRQFVLLLVGYSGHGKSKTINRLLRQDLLTIGRKTLGSTTKAIHRVRIREATRDPATDFTVAVDDTPGLGDTTYRDRTVNASLMRAYKERYFPTGASQIYPNIILLVASWDSITQDAHNEPRHFTSAVGKSMYSLASSGLVDNDRANAVVVVTKSMSSWDQFDDFKSFQKNAQWNIQAARRKRIIIDLQRKVFPKLAPWLVIFIENGGGTDIRAEYATLPNGETSHKNLFDTIRAVIEKEGPKGTKDIAGIRALAVLAGADASDLVSTAETQILINPTEDIIGPEISSTDPNHSSPEKRIQAITDTYFGVTYNPIRRTMGHKNVLSLEPAEIQFRDGPGPEMNDFAVAVAQQEPLEKPNVAGLIAQYSNSAAFLSALSTKSDCFVFRYVSKVAYLDSARPQLSPEMKRVVERLPRWSPKSKQQYIEFFGNHGTHVITALALGGALRVIVESTEEKVSKKRTSSANKKVVDTTASDRSMQTRKIRIFRDGGGALASEITKVLEDRFTNSAHPSDWEGLRTRWIKDLGRDPVFCPDSNLTEFRFLHALGGLTGTQQEDLKQATEFYLRLSQRKTSSRKEGPTRRKSTPAETGNHGAGCW
ncbi:hypothetical protein DFH08DRAFT_317356 [Mycena albidolilacea]|uniref:MACPF domain-containing protein n=1 Tax=Mycena albidolilacea TaxID=1033008 RepID=A0AAD6ZN17_9AGAR|nr:hypothetical protein DFH08DRAFT_317356 [Mycena albidolilacea]